MEQGDIVAAAVGDPSGVDAVELGLVADVRTYPGDDTNLTYSKSPMAMKRHFLITIAIAIGSHSKSILYIIQQSHYLFSGTTRSV